MNIFVQEGVGAIEEQEYSLEIQLHSLALQLHHSSTTRHSFFIPSVCIFFLVASASWLSQVLQLIAKPQQEHHYSL